MNKPKSWSEVVDSRLKITSEIKDIDAKASGTRIVFRSSTDVRDRDQEFIDIDGWRWNETALPNQFYCHDTRTAVNWIGKGARVWKGSDGLFYETELFDKSPSPLAEIARQVAWIAQEHPDAIRCSVGFLPDEWVDPNGSKHTRENPGNSPPWSTPGRRYLRQELLENSVAPVPSNPESLAVSVRDFGAVSEWDNKTIEQIAERVRAFFDRAKEVPEPKDERPWIERFFSPSQVKESAPPSGEHKDEQTA